MPWAPEPIRTALYSYCRLRAVTSAMAADAPGSQHSATLYRTIGDAAVPRFSQAGTTQAKRTEDRETSCLPLPGCAPEVQVERISGGRAPMSRSPLGWSGEFLVLESRDPGAPVPATSCHFVPTAHTLTPTSGSGLRPQRLFTS